MNNSEPLTLYSLNNLVRNVIAQELPMRYWVTGELSEVRETAAGHCYIELVQRDEVTGELVAKARGTIWQRVYSLLSPYFYEETGRAFSSGVNVLLQVKVTFHELYGYTLEVCDIEPSYTVGETARRRRLVINRLEKEGVINLNKEIDFPALPQRVAVISSSHAAGYGDFCDQLLGNEYGFVFYPHLFPAPMQGSKVELGIIAALDRIAADIDMWDVVVIIRGGGATSELSCFDTYDLANNCAQFPLPIITGIGHQRDESVLDMVAHTRAKTPTAAAEFLIHSMLEQAQRLWGVQQCIVSAVRNRIDGEKHRLLSIVQRMPVATALFMQSHHHKLDLWQKYMEASSPERILALGYSITRVNGKAVCSTADVKAGDKVTTTVYGGDFTSIITEKNDI